jgi:ankyrin repeat protein
MSNTRLYNYCKVGNLKAVENEIKLGADGFNEALYWACANGNTQLVEYLLKLGAIDYKFGLDGAFYYGNILMVKHMLELGANRAHYYNYYDYQYKVIALLETGLDHIYLKKIDGYDKLITDLNNFKKETKDSIQEYLLDPIIDIINSYSLL